MARRSVLLMVAVLIALIGTALIVLYVQGIDERATEGQELVEVLVATDTLNTGESVTTAQEAGKFEKKQVRRDDMVPGALSSTASITDLVAVGTIYPGQQLIAKHFGNLGDAESLVIPDGKIAISVELSDPARVAGFVNPGSQVAIFVSAEPLLRTPTGEEEVTLPPVTRVLLENVQVIGVGATSTTSKTTTDESGQSTTEQLPKTLLTLAVDQKEAEKVIYAARNGELTFALTTDNSKVRDQPGVTAVDILPDAFRGTP